MAGARQSAISIVTRRWVQLLKTVSYFCASVSVSSRGVSAWKDEKPFSMQAWNKMLSSLARSEANLGKWGRRVGGRTWETKLRMEGGRERV